MGIAGRRRGQAMPSWLMSALTFLGVAVLTACGQRIPGTPLATDQPPGSEQESRPPHERITAPPEVLGGGTQPQPGECLNSGRFRTEECGRPHDIEITQAGRLPDELPSTYPDEQTMLRAALPPCRA